MAKAHEARLQDELRVSFEVFRDIVDCLNGVGTPHAAKEMALGRVMALREIVVKAPAGLVSVGGGDAV